MSREQTARSPLSSEAASTEGTGATLEARLSALAVEARQEPGTRREEIVSALNAMLARLPREASPEEASAALSRLLEGGLLDGLEDAEGLPAGIAATRAFMALDYPHALKVPPERLEALNRWRAPALEVPRGTLSAVLTVAAFVQLVFMVAVDSGMRRLTRMTYAALAGLPEEPTLEVRLRQSVGDVPGPLYLSQLALTVLAFAFAMVAAGRREWRTGARRGFLGLGVLGALVGGLQAWLGLDEGWGTLASAGGSLIAGWLLREP